MKNLRFFAHCCFPEKIHFGKVFATAQTQQQSNHRSTVSMTFCTRTLFLVVPPCLLLLSCGDEAAREEQHRIDSVAKADSIRRTDSAIAAKRRAEEEVFPRISYQRVAVTKAILDSIRKRFAYTKDTAAHRAIITMNRKEFGYFHVGDTISLPDTIVSDLRAYSIFPQRYPAADSIKKIILISNKFQSYACYENGKLVRFAACNTGTERKPTLPGRYALNWKERLRISSLNEFWKLPYTWNFHLHAGNAFHQFAMPGRPVSHSCVRQFMTDAKWLFDWGEGARRENGRFVPLSGTPVVILDMFDFTRKRGGPWLELTSNRDSILRLPDAPMQIEEALIPISQVPADARGGLPDRQRYLTAEDTLKARGIIRKEVQLSWSIDYNKRRKAKQAAAAAAAEKKKPASNNSGQ